MNRSERRKNREQSKELLGGAFDLEGVNILATDLRKKIIEMMYDEELKIILVFLNMVQGL